MTKFAVLFCLIFFCLENCTGEENLVSVAIVYRHGDRTPDSTYPNDPYNDILFKDYEPGELTKVGKQRQYALGQFLRQRYADFLPKNYSKNDIYVLSDDMDRCLMSAASNLAGLYPPTESQAWNKEIQWQPIPIHINIDLLWGDPKDCDKYEQLQQELSETDYIKNIIKENQEIFEILTNETGMDVKELKDLTELQTIFYIESLLNLTLPSWTEGIYPEKLLPLHALALSLAVNNTQLTRFSAGPLLNEVIEDFDTKTHKFTVYSAHDTNIVQLVLTLAPNTEMFYPEFGSMVVFELWENAGVEYVKAFLKRTGDIEEIVIEGCDGGCDFDQFRELLKDVVVSLEQSKLECKV